MKNVALVLSLLTALPAPGRAAEAQTFKHRIMGLFSRDREAELREAVKKMAGVEIVSIDFDVAEVTFSYDPGTLFQKGTKEKDFLERFDNLLRQSSNHSFGAKPLFPTPKEKLVRVEIGVVLPDCKGCCYGVYLILANADGVAQATADLKEGRVTALIDPEKTNLNTLQTTLKKREVKLKGS